MGLKAVQLAIALRAPFEIALEESVWQVDVGVASKVSLTNESLVT